MSECRCHQQVKNYHPEITSEKHDILSIMGGMLKDLLRWLVCCRSTPKRMAKFKPDLEAGKLWEWVWDVSASIVYQALGFFFCWFLAPSLGMVWTLRIWCYGCGLGLCHWRKIRVSELPWVLWLEAWVGGFSSMHLCFCEAAFGSNFLQRPIFPIQVSWHEFWNGKELKDGPLAGNWEDMPKQTHTRCYFRPPTEGSLGPSTILRQVTCPLFLYLFISPIRSLIFPCGFCCSSIF